MAATFGPSQRDAATFLVDRRPAVGGILHNYINEQRSMEPDRSGCAKYKRSQPELKTRGR